MMSFGKRSLALLLILALLPLGIGTVAAQNDEEVDTSDWVLYQGEKTYVQAPPEWADMQDEEALDQAIDLVGELNPDIQAAVDAAGAQVNAGSFDIFLVDVVTGANLNVIATDVGSEIPLEMLEPTLTSQYEALNAELIEISQVELPSGTALRAVIAMPLNMPGGAVEILDQIQLIFIQDTSLYVLTVSAGEDDFEELRPTLDAIGESFGIGEAPAELAAAGETGEKPPAEVIEPEGRSDVVRHDTPWISIIAPPDWFAARDEDAFNEYLATNGGHPAAPQFFETLAGDVQGGTYQYILVQPDDLAYMTLVIIEIGADIPISTFQEPQEATVKSDPDMNFIDGDIVTLPSGDALRIEVVRPIRQQEDHHELRYFWMSNQNLIFMILAVPEAIYPEYEQIFDDIVNTVSFPE